MPSCACSGTMIPPRSTCSRTSSSIAARTSSTDLRDLAAVDDATVSGHAHDILAEIESRQAFDEFTLLCHLFADDGDIEDACWLLARIFLPGIETEHYQRKLDIWGRQLKRLTDSRHLHPRARRHPHELPRQRPRLPRQFRAVLRRSQFAAAEPDRLQAGHPHFAGGALYRGGGAGGHQDRGHQPAGAFHRAARGHFLRSVPPGENPHALGLRVDLAQAKADLPAFVPGTGDLAHDPRSACWRTCSTSSRTTATRRSTSASPTGSRRWSASSASFPGGRYFNAKAQRRGDSQRKTRKEEKKTPIRGLSLSSLLFFFSASLRVSAPLR